MPAKTSDSSLKDRCLFCGRSVFAFSFFSPESRHGAVRHAIPDIDFLHLLFSYSQRGLVSGGWLLCHRLRRRVLRRWFSGANVSLRSTGSMAARATSASSILRRLSQLSSVQLPPCRSAGPDRFKLGSKSWDDVFSPVLQQVSHVIP